METVVQFEEVEAQKVGESIPDETKNRLEGMKKKLLQAFTEKWYNIINNKIKKDGLYCCSDIFFSDLELSGLKNLFKTEIRNGQMFFYSQPIK